MFYSRLLLIITICSFTMLMSCDETDDNIRNVEIYSIKDIGVLSTCEYTISKVIELKDRASWYKFGDRDILMSCKAKIEAGVRLDELKNEDIKVDGKRIKILLPYPEILSFDMDPQSIKTELESVNGLRSTFSQEEKNNILRQGEESIKANMGRTQILKQAKENARVFIENFYKELNFEEVIIEFKKPHEKEIPSS